MKFESLIESDPEKMSGTPVFVGTRVPIQNLFDSLKSGENLEDFLDQYPTVAREQVMGVLEALKHTVLAEYERAA